MAYVIHDRERDDRMLRYGAHPLDQDKWVVIRVEADYAATYAGQIATMVAANLIGRLSRSVAIDAPDIPLVARIPGSGKNLTSELLAGMRACNPRGKYERWSNQTDSPYVIHLGPNGDDEVVHGSGWAAYIGPPPSPMSADPSDPLNPIGPAFSAVAAATRMFVHRFDPPPISRVFNCYSWNSSDGDCESASGLGPSVPANIYLGNIWTVGCGSVGSAILYFLGLAGADFSASLFDLDEVEHLNITRSPLFNEEHVGQPKVSVSAQFLSNCGITEIAEYVTPLDQAGMWETRPQGTPDILIPAANERNVRSLIESYYPPLQIYGSTGVNWQATSMSHVPMQPGCSLCLFPETQSPAMACATDADASTSESDEEQADISLPFLSFAAGLMAAADILKVAIGDYPYIERRGMFNTWDGPRLTNAPSFQRPDCVCQSRSTETYKAIIIGSRYADLHG